MLRKGGRVCGRELLCRGFCAVCCLLARFSIEVHGDWVAVCMRQGGHTILNILTSYSN